MLLQLEKNTKKMKKKLMRKQLNIKDCKTEKK